MTFLLRSNGAFLNSDLSKRYWISVILLCCMWRSASLILPLRLSCGVAMMISSWGLLSCTDLRRNGAVFVCSSSAFSFICYVCGGHYLHCKLKVCTGKYLQKHGGNIQKSSLHMEWGWLMGRENNYIVTFIAWPCFYNLSSTAERGPM